MPVVIYEEHTPVNFIRYGVRLRKMTPLYPHTSSAKFLQVFGAWFQYSSTVTSPCQCRETLCFVMTVKRWVYYHRSFQDHLFRLIHIYLDFDATWTACSTHACDVTKLLSFFQIKHTIRDRPSSRYGNPIVCQL